MNRKGLNCDVITRETVTLKERVWLKLAPGVYGRNTHRFQGKKLILDFKIYGLFSNLHVELDVYFILGGNL